MKAIQIEAFGKPVEVVKVVEIPDVGAPGAGEVVPRSRPRRSKSSTTRCWSSIPDRANPGSLWGSARAVKG
jgi:hypothetical protein